MLNEKTYDKIVELKKYLGTGINKTIVNIIEQMTPYLEKHGVSFKDEDAHYLNLGGDDEYRKHVHVFMPREMYNRFKKLHLDLDYYSMAQILRHVIDLYLKERMNHGINGYKKKLESFKRNWELKKRKVLKEGKEFLRQLTMKSVQKQHIPVQFVKYDYLFRPITM